MSDAIIFENISKQYRLGLVSTKTLSHDLNRFWKMNVLGKEDPYLKIGEVNDRAHKGESDYVWALKDINFKVEQGDVLGIIGKNGAGKSTLLKILSKVTAPTTGTIKAAGRIASLLEVGTGFHPEMTGRENIFMNGAIMGMTKREITSKLDEIVDFSGVERYIDTPAKRYSSGMTVRLGFAIAAHLEPEILVVDEVLAVGDAEFQKKAIGKMQDVSKGEGRTVLFVSHNMASVQALCKNGVVLENGTVKYHDIISKTIDYYIRVGDSTSNYKAEVIRPTQIHTIKIVDSNGTSRSNFNFDENVTLKFRFRVEDVYREHSQISIRVIDQRLKVVFSSEKQVSFFYKNNDCIYNVNCKIPENILVPNGYKVVVALHIPNKKILDYLEDVVNFNIEETGTNFHLYAGNDYGCVFVDCKWENEIANEEINK